MDKKKLVPFIVLEAFINGVHPVSTVWEGKIAPYVPADNPALDAHALELAERDARIAALEEQVAARDADIKAALEAATLAQGPDGKLAAAPAAADAGNAAPATPASGKNTNK